VSQVSGDHSVLWPALPEVTDQGGQYLGTVFLTAVRFP